MVTAFNSEPVERAGIIPNHFVDDAFRYAGQRFERRQQVALLKGIVVAVVRADHQIILTDAVHDDGKVLAGFTGDKNAKLAEKILGRREFPLLAELPFKGVQKVWHPRRISFDEADSELGKLFRNPVVDDVVEGEQRQNGRVGPLAVTLQVEEVDERRATGALMNADRQIEIARFLIDREKVRIIQCSSALDAAKEDSDGAMSWKRKELTFQLKSKA